MESVFFGCYFEFCRHLLQDLELRNLWEDLLACQLQCYKRCEQLRRFQLDPDLSPTGLNYHLIRCERWTLPAYTLKPTLRVAFPLPNFSQ